VRTKEEYYQAVLGYRRIVADPDNRRCTCPKTKCEWHGRCAKCVTLHRYHQDHLPNCFQQYEKIKALAAIGELVTAEKEKTPGEYWDYIREEDKR
jgi:hypothetical protein